jgi:hypothetical protein
MIPWLVDDVLETDPITGNTQGVDGTPGREGIWLAKLVVVGGITNTHLLSSYFLTQDRKEKITLL